MEDSQTPEPLYLKGFNEGYIIAKNLPVFARNLLKDAPKGLRTSGFCDGQKQYVIELSREFKPAWLKGEQISKASNQKTKDKDRDVDSRE